MLRAYANNVSIFRFNMISNFLTFGTRYGLSTLFQSSMVAILFSMLVMDVNASDLRQVFLKPPEEAKPRGYWVWPHGNFDYSTIRQELAEFKARGLSGVDIFDLGIRDSKNVIPPGPGFMSEEQVDGIAFAINEAKQLGLKIGLIVSSSWNAGASWTPPEDALMNLVAWKETVIGPIQYDRILPFPELPDKFKKPYGVFPLYVPRDEKGSPIYKKNYVVMAFPVDANGVIADLENVRILNNHLDTSDRLKYDFPDGRWVVMRTVIANFGQRLWLPSDRSQGLIIDHFSKQATRNHFNTVISRLEKRLGSLKDTALERLYLASYESNAGVIWTPDFHEAFYSQNGYPIEPFLPALFGFVVANREKTDRFLYDYRKTVSELFIDNFYREARRICHEKGLLLCSEAGGPGAPLHDVPTEDLKALSAVDVMRGEFWNEKTGQLTPDGFEELQIVKPIASAAHIYGHRIVEMEAFTSHINWQEGPDIFKKLADRAFCEGMTRPVYHTMAHIIPEAGKPGWTYSAGSHMGPNLTWWGMSDQLHSYLARASALLMQGHFVADVAYYYGHAIPNFAKPKHVRTGLGFGYDYDDLNTEILLQASVNKNGRITLPSGMSYALLVLPDNDRSMDLKVIQKIEKLLEQGATIIGSKPERIYGLRGYPREEQELQKIADRLWGAEPGLPSERTIGQGKLITGKTEREVLLQMGQWPDLEVYPSSEQQSIDFIHRRTSNEDIYLIRNSGHKTVEIEARFFVHGKRPELWNAVQGTMVPVAVYQKEDKGVVLPLRLTANGSVFVVFTPEDLKTHHITAIEYKGQPIFPNRKSELPGVMAIGQSNGYTTLSSERAADYVLKLSNGKQVSGTIKTESPSFEITGSWEVRFPFGWGVPTRQVFDSLRSWTESTNAATRSFSGIAVYTKQFEIRTDQNPKGQRVLLDLGHVAEAARVYLNGYDAGISCFSPHVLDISGLIRTGANFLVIEVANTWLNRLIADDSLPEEQRKTHTNLTTGSDKRWRNMQPKPSGLLGPVLLRFPSETSVRLDLN